MFVNDEEGGTVIKKRNVGPTTRTERILDSMTLARQEGGDGCNDVHPGAVRNGYRVNDQDESFK